MTVEVSPRSFAALSAMAWKLYRQCRDSSGHASIRTKKLASSVGTLYVLLMECNEYIQEGALNDARKSTLKNLDKICSVVLRDLEALLLRADMESSRRMFGPETNWDLEVLGQEDVDGLAKRVERGVEEMTAFNEVLMCFSNIKIEKVITRFVAELRERRRDDLLSTEIMQGIIDALESKGQDAWSQIRGELSRELEGMGLSETVFMEKEKMIFKRLWIAVESGELERDWEEGDRAPTPNSDDDVKSTEDSERGDRVSTSDSYDLLSSQDASSRLSTLSLTPVMLVFVSDSEGSTLQTSQEALDSDLVLPDPSRKSQLAQLASEAKAFYHAKSLKDMPAKPWLEIPWVERANSFEQPGFKKALGSSINLSEKVFPCSRRLQARLAAEAVRYIASRHSGYEAVKPGKRVVSISPGASPEHYGVHQLKLLSPINDPERICLGKTIDKGKCLPILFKEQAFGEPWRTRCLRSPDISKTPWHHSPFQYSAYGPYPLRSLKAPKSPMACHGPNRGWKFSTTDQVYCIECRLVDYLPRYLPYLNASISRLAQVPAQNLKQQRIGSTLRRTPLVFKASRAQVKMAPVETRPSSFIDEIILSETRGLEMDFQIAASMGDEDCIREILQSRDLHNTQALHPNSPFDEAFWRATYRGHLSIMTLLDASRSQTEQNKASQSILQKLLPLNSMVREDIVSAVMDQRLSRNQTEDDILSRVPASDHQCEILFLFCWLVDPYNVQGPAPWNRPALKFDILELAQSLGELFERAPLGPQSPCPEIMPAQCDFVLQSHMQKRWEKHCREGSARSHSNRFWSTVLCWAATNGLTELARYLVCTRHFDPNAPDSFGRSPLLLAAKCGRVATVQLLLSWPAVDVNLQDRQGRTALLEAVRQGETFVAKLLLRRQQIDVNLRDFGNHSPLYWAVYRKHRTSVKLLLASSDVDISGSWDGLLNDELLLDIMVQLRKSQKWKFRTIGVERSKERI